MQAISQPRITPWVLRLIIANAVVLLLLETVFTSDRLLGFLAFDPSASLRRPWTFLTYMFVHGDLFHLAANSLGLWMLGSPVEHRLGSRRFLLFYLYCGIGAAVFSVLVAGLTPVNPFVGASGAVLGIVVAFAMLWPDAEMLLFPIPVPIKARTLAIGIVGLNALFALPLFRGGSMIAYEAHLGGALFGYLYFRLQALSAAAPVAPVRSTVHRVVPVPPRAPESEREQRQPSAVQPATRRRRNEGLDPVTSEIDRVLDKISAQGIESLTPAERRFLDEVSQRKRQEPN
ncbi:MAG TPA: rhomboid family intramembrane serine protease [Gemmatimonadales bacterium]|nr:rhomboid family intramembrane serine protease [Gemmatimonadales bacterium]